jgi:hypothetical protein
MSFPIGDDETDVGPYDPDLSISTKPSFASGMGSDCKFFQQNVNKCVKIQQHIFASQYHQSSSSDEKKHNQASMEDGKERVSILEIPHG